jgi:hypothetical protein
MHTSTQFKLPPGLGTVGKIVQIGPVYVSDSKITNQNYFKRKKFVQMKIGFDVRAIQGSKEGPINGHISFVEIMATDTR